jgi:alkylhydroperoxidase/carboxymuconolactone decarboxylase family protein YurZ
MTNDSLDDLAAFLMHRTADAGSTDAERRQTFALVAAYQEGDDPPRIEVAMRAAAARFASHPDYRAEWRPEPTDAAEAGRYQQALDTAERLLGQPLVLPLGEGEPPAGADFRRLATIHAFGDSWSRGGLDTRSRALISVAIAATLGTHEPLRGQLRIALNSGVTKEELVELFIHLEAYAGAARAFDSYQMALAVFAER